MEPLPYILLPGTKHVPLSESELDDEPASIGSLTPFIACLTDDDLAPFYSSASFITALRKRDHDQCIVCSFSVHVEHMYIIPPKSETGEDQTEKPWSFFNASKHPDLQIFHKAPVRRDSSLSTAPFPILLEDHAMMCGGKYAYLWLKGRAASNQGERRWTVLEEEKGKEEGTEGTMEQGTEAGTEEGTVDGTELLGKRRRVDDEDDDQQISRIKLPRFPDVRFPPFPDSKLPPLPGLTYKVLSEEEWRGEYGDLAGPDSTADDAVRRYLARVAQ
ncbi:hypothetical protein HDV00_012564 [Rhizophlyctis rosea]|nr:hypothetical protein HDV00_012564 [Rhizophlyctis rosea]